MDKRLNIALIGFGRFGKKYYKTLLKLNLFKKIIIYRKKKNKKFEKLNKKSLVINNVNLAIIVTPVDTHYKIASLLLKNKIPFILEKPVSKNISEIYKLQRMSKTNKTSVLVNYSDLFNKNFRKIIKIRNKIGKINYFHLHFGKFNGNYFNKSFLPHFDWFPHILAIIYSFFKKIKDIKIIKSFTVKRKSFYFQSIILILKLSNNLNAKITFSNIKKGKERKFFIKSNDSQILYNGNIDNENFIKIKNKLISISKKEYTPMEKIVLELDKIKKNNLYFSNLDFSVKVHKTLNKINLMLSKIN